MIYLQNRRCRSMLTSNNELSKNVPSTNEILKMLDKNMDYKFYVNRSLKNNWNNSLEATRHYWEIGWQEGRDPTDWFSTLGYLEKHPDIKEADINPFVHYLFFGKNEERKITSSELLDEKTITSDLNILSQEIDDDYYRVKNQIKHPQIDTTFHYYKVGWQLGLDPVNWFSTKTYLKNNPDVVKLNINPFVHYLQFGKKEGRNITPSRNENEIFELDLMFKNMDIGYYEKTYPDIVEHNMDSVEHYYYFGWKEGRNPTNWFSSNGYLNTNPDVIPLKVNPFVHYLRFGKAEGRKPTTLKVDIEKLELDLVAQNMDARYYKNMYPDILSRGLDPFEHYYYYGWKEGRNPTEWFSSNLYLETNPDVKDLETNPFVHYIRFGKQEGRKLGNEKQLEQQKQSQKLNDIQLRSAVNYVKKLLHPKNQKFDKDCLSIHWVIPDFGTGGGGHMTIFRMVRWLEFFGHTCKIWVIAQNDNYDETNDEKISDWKRTVLTHYQVLNASILPLPKNPDVLSGDIIIATGWNTVYPVLNASNFKERFYFVQDYETKFYAEGAHALLAEQTYHEDLACICAGPWLSKLMNKRYDRWARHFWLAYDKNIYYSLNHPPKKKEIRIAVYARTSTSRRCVELALLALEIVAKENPNIVVDFFGNHESVPMIPCEFNVLGILSSNELSQLYNNSTIGICFSATNYSLVPQEMMACGLPVIELDLDSTRAIFPEGTISLAKPHPNNIADKINTLIHDVNLRKQQANEALTWVNSFSWEHSAKLIEKALIDRLTEKQFLQLQSHNDNEQKTLKASIVIPTFNAMESLPKLLEVLRNQKCPWGFEIAIIDSSSTDGTEQFCASQSNLIFKSITQSEFKHGKTRNDIIKETKGEYIVLITQDALPTNELWLYDFVTTLEQFPAAGGAFGKHIANTNASEFTKRDLDNHFKNFDRFPMNLSNQIDRAQFNLSEEQWKQLLHFFSDNNACLRRTIWEKHPYPDVEYGEDQLWAQKIINEGYEKVYAKHAVVYHSHDYSPEQTKIRAKTEAQFFYNFFGYHLIDLSIPLENLLQTLNDADEKWGIQNDIIIDSINHQKNLNRAKLEGYYSFYQSIS